MMMMMVFVDWEMRMFFDGEMEGLFSGEMVFLDGRRKNNM